MTTANVMAQRIGETASYHVGDLSFQVYILDARLSWGRVHYQVQPVAGDGAKWVDADSLQISA